MQYLNPVRAYLPRSLEAINFVTKYPPVIYVVAAVAAVAFAFYALSLIRHCWRPKAPGGNSQPLPSHSSKPASLQQTAPLTQTPLKQPAQPAASGSTSHSQSAALRQPTPKMPSPLPLKPASLQQPAPLTQAPLKQTAQPAASGSTSQHSPQMPSPLPSKPAAVIHQSTQSTALKLDAPIPAQPPSALPPPSLSSKLPAVEISLRKDVPPPARPATPQQISPAPSLASAAPVPPQDTDKPDLIEVQPQQPAQPSAAPQPLTVVSQVVKMPYEDATVSPQDIIDKKRMKNNTYYLIKIDEDKYNLIFKVSDVVKVMEIEQINGTFYPDTGAYNSLELAISASAPNCKPELPEKPIGILAFFS